jgi:hypothetical protein
MKRILVVACLGLLASGGVSAQSASVVTAVEFYDVTVGQYFITADPDETNLLDAGGVWMRTGNTFNVFSAAAITPGASPVCRLYGNMPGGPDLHFFSASQDECAQTLAAAPNVWSVESSDVFQAFLPDTTNGSCPDGTIPLYRSFSPANGGHRYATDPNVQAAMVAQGSIAEGYGGAPVAMCTPM